MQQISGERLQDHWSSGFISCWHKEKSGNINCFELIGYICVLCQAAQLAVQLRKERGNSRKFDDSSSDISG